MAREYASIMKGDTQEKFCKSPKGEDRREMNKEDHGENRSQADCSPHSIGDLIRKSEIKEKGESLEKRGMIFTLPVNNTGLKCYKNKGCF